MSLGSPGAWASSHVPPDPTANYRVGNLPYACSVSATSRACVNAVVYFLDQARARLNKPAYQLPADFASLTAVRQAFILTNLDRLAYKLPPIVGLTAALGHDSLNGVYSDSDPSASDPNIAGTTSNWAGSFANMALAYEAWMYDDGYGSGNIDCTSAAAPGCWGHRHDVLTSFPAGKTAMGAAVGKDAHGAIGYAMLLAVGRVTYRPTYIYTWAQAVKDGAGTHLYKVSKPATATLTLHFAFSGPDLVVHIGPPAGSNLHCSLVRQKGGKFPSPQFKPCSASPKFPVSSGQYRFIVTSRIGWAKSDLTIT
jgi:hypothetical protein